MINKNKILLITILIGSFSCTAKNNLGETNIDNIAESYVKLVLRVGLYDPYYVDAYYGPQKWKSTETRDNQKKEFQLDQLKGEVIKLISQLRQIEQSKFNKLGKLRYTYLEKQLLSVKAKIDLLSGKKMTFDEESKALYDVVAPIHNEDYFKDILKELDNVLPGNGEISERYAKFRNEFVIPQNKLDVVFKAALAECRKRTLKFIELPEVENFTVEYVTDKPWGAYNWYKGKFFSVIQVNTDLPVYIDWALHLAGHEGYPGHHIYNSLLEKRLFRDKNWVEFSVYPLFSPQSLIAEGTADYGIEVAFPGNERVEFERDVLFPMVGLDPSNAEKYHKILQLTHKLDYAIIDAARRYIDGKDSKEQAINWLIKYSLETPERAEHILRFIEGYRSYVINYNLGKDIIENYIEKHGVNKDNLQKRWALFTELLSTPQTPSGLQ